LQFEEGFDMAAFNDINLLAGSDDHRTMSIISTSKFPQQSLAKLKIINESIFNEPVAQNETANARTGALPIEFTSNGHLPIVQVIFRLIHGGLGPSPITPDAMDSPICALKQIAQLATLDKKQEAAYGIICSSFIKYCFTQGLETKVQNDERIELERNLDDLGAKEQLIMFLSGCAGGGKSHVVDTCEQFCKLFCDHCDLPFDENVFMLTACTGCAAAAFQHGRTIHSVAGLNRKRISQDLKDLWVLTNTLVIDEVSFFPIGPSTETVSW
jgi:hypothetical protein